MLEPVAKCYYPIFSPLPNPASEDGSESEGSESSSRSCRNERSLQEKLQALMAEGLLPAVKVFLDWLRTNPDLIIVCAQVFIPSSNLQVLNGWNSDDRERGLCSCVVTCQEPDWPGSSRHDLSLKESTARGQRGNCSLYSVFPKPTS